MALPSSVLSAVGPLLAAGLVLVLPTAAGAQAADLQRQIADSRLRLEEIRAERERLQRDLEGARSGVRDLSRELGNIERRLSASRSVLAELELQLEIGAAEAVENSRSLLLVRVRHEGASVALHRRLREVYKLGPLHTVRVLLGADSFTDLLNRYRYIRMIALYDRSLIERVGRLEADLRTRSDQFETDLADLERLREAQLVEMAELRSVEAERQHALTSYRSREMQTLSRLETLDRDEQRMHGLIGELEEARVAMEGRLGAARRPTEATSLSASDAGSLEWPVGGEILYRFGVERRPDGTVLRWNGLGIAAATGAPVRAVRDGTVALAGPFEGYGPTVVLSHGEGFYTLYLYLEDIGVVQGRRVETGQVVGTVGGQDTPEGPHVEFQIRTPASPGGTPQALDPLPWLRPRPGPDGR